MVEIELVAVAEVLCCIGGGRQSGLGDVGSSMMTVGEEREIRKADRNRRPTVAGPSDYAIV